MGSPTPTENPDPIPDISIEREAPAVLTTVSIRLRRQPACPICGGAIRNSVLTVMYDIAFCPPCANKNRYEVLRVSQLIRHPELARHFTCAAGISWFTPRDLNRMSLATLTHAAGLKNLYLSLPFDPWGNQIHLEEHFFDPKDLEVWKTPLTKGPKFSPSDDPPYRFHCTNCHTKVQTGDASLNGNKLCHQCSDDKPEKK